MEIDVENIEQRPNVLLNRTEIRFTVNHDGEATPKREALREALAALPGEEFEQVHRSHVVNLRRVEKIKRQGQAFQLTISGTRDTVPASRHRAASFLPKLRQMAD